MDLQQKINCLETAIFHLLQIDPQIAEENSTGKDMLDGLWQIHQDLNIQMYPIIDDIWPSRRWNLDKTDYIDLSSGMEIPS